MIGPNFAAYAGLNLCQSASVPSADIIGVYHHGGPSVLNIFSIGASFQLWALGFLKLLLSLGYLLVLRSPTVCP